MTEKDFILIASALKEAQKHAIYSMEPAARDAHALICNEMAIALSKTNPKFRRYTFLSACGLSDAVVDAL